MQNTEWYYKAKLTDRYVELMHGDPLTPTASGSTKSDQADEDRLRQEAQPFLNGLAKEARRMVNEGAYAQE